MRRFLVALYGLAYAAALLGGIAAIAIYATSYSAPKPCAAIKQTAAISQRAAQLCSTELVGCSLSFEQLKGILAEQEAARVCR